MLGVLGTTTVLALAGAPSFDLIEGAGVATTYAGGLSGDGRVVVGQAEIAGDPPRIEAYRWEGGALERLGDLPGGLAFASAEGVDRTGAVVVGVAWRALGAGEAPANPDDTSGIEVAFRWTRATGMRDLGELAGGTVRALASDVTADGAIAVGASYDARDDFVACRWDGDDAPVALGAFPSSAPRSDARAVSADGAVVVGGSPTDEPGGGLGTRSFAWTAAGGLVDLGDLAGGGTFSSVADVSGDGRVAVGAATSITSGTGELEAWRAVIGERPEALGDLPGGMFYSEALAVDATGSVIVGRSAVTDDGQEEAFVWTRAGGMERLAAVAARAGVVLPEGWLLSQATDVSSDGLVIVGNAIDTTGRVAAFRLALSDAALPRPDKPGSPVPLVGASDDGCTSGPAPHLLWLLLSVARACPWRRPRAAPACRAPLA